MGRDGTSDWQRDDSRDVSIHAPAWGATVAEVDVVRVANVSIHAPAWGATNRFQGRKCDCVCFNPRARMGRDLTCVAILESV